MGGSLFVQKWREGSPQGDLSRACAGSMGEGRSETLTSPQPQHLCSSQTPGSLLSCCGLGLTEYDKSNNKLVPQIWADFSS